MNISLLESCIETLTNRQSFKDAYENTFELIRAEDEDARDKVLRLRYRVYCREHELESPCETDSYTEHDEYDARSAHFILRHRISNEIAGTVRVILPDDTSASSGLQAQTLCDHPLLHRQDAEAPRLCEISRFCTASRFRKRDGDGKFLSAYFDQDLIETDENGKTRTIRRMIAYMPAALMCGAFEAAMEAGILDCVWLVEPCHLESLQQIGFSYATLGPQVDYHGGAQPVIFNIKHSLDNMHREAPHCWEVVSDGGRLQDLADALAQDMWQDNLVKNYSK